MLFVRGTVLWLLYSDEQKYVILSSMLSWGLQCSIKMIIELQPDLSSMKEMN